MPTYALWNNKGGVGKSYLTFQIAAEYARQHPHERILVVDLCPQGNASTMLLGGMLQGESILEALCGATPPRSVSGYIADRVVSPYVNPRSGANYLTHVRGYNHNVSSNLYLISGDESLELQSGQIQLACSAGPDDAWRIVHTWIRDLIADVAEAWNKDHITVFIDCNPSFTVYTELALNAADRLIIPFSADGSSKRAVRSVLSLVYGVLRRPGQNQSEFYRNCQRFNMALPQIYAYVGNRLTQMNYTSARAFRVVVNEIFAEIFRVWQTSPHVFQVHPSGSPAPVNRQQFRAMFEYEVNDANTASVVSGALGVPICVMTAGTKMVAGKNVKVNQSQLDRQQPNITGLVTTIE